MLKKKKIKAVPNRKRAGFELTRQRALVPIALGAGTAAVVAHVFAYFCFPTWDFAKKSAYATPKNAKEKIVRVKLEDIPDVEYLKADEPKPEEIDAQEIKEIVQTLDTKEIDILDYQLEELELSHLDTELPFPAPTPEPEKQESEPEVTTPELGADALPPHVSSPPEKLPEPPPAPVDLDESIRTSNNPDPDGNISAGSDDPTPTQSTPDGKGELPPDTRSLGELMGLTNLGSDSGVARLKGDLLFEYDKCRLSTTARRSMLDLAALIQMNPETNFVIEGHTDNFGKDDYNALLSLQRAAAVCDWLAKNSVPMEHVYIRACGNKAPLVSGSKKTREEQSLNRRVEIHMRRKGEPLPEGCLPASYDVDLKTPTKEQLQKGVRAPETFAPSGTSEETDAQAAARAGQPAPDAPKQDNKDASSGNGK